MNHVLSKNQNFSRMNGIMRDMFWFFDLFDQQVMDVIVMRPYIHILWFCFVYKF